MRANILLALSAVFFIALTVWIVTAMWADVGFSLTLHGWIAYGLGGLGSLALSIGLFWLVFHSARSGHDNIDKPEDLNH